MLPFVLRCVMSGSDMSDLLASWCEQHDIALEQLPEAHHKLAIRERNHAVRRMQVLNLRRDVSTTILVVR